MRRRAGFVSAAVILTLACGPPEPAGPVIADLQRAHEALRAQLARATSHDPLFAAADAAGGQIAVAVRTQLVRDLIERVGHAALDRVTLDLVREIPIHAGGAFSARTPLGTVKAGDWSLDVTLHRIQGLLRARPPDVNVTRGNQVRVRTQVEVARGSGTALAVFAWKPSGVARVVCRPFELRQEIRGMVAPDSYRVEAVFELKADGATIVARPTRAPQPFRLRVDLTPESWDAVLAQMRSQDTLTKCGVVIDPDALLPRLKELVHAGFDLKLPTELLRPVALPAGVRSSLVVDDRAVALAVAPHALTLTPDAIWYSADVQTLVQRRDAPGSK